MIANIKSLTDIRLMVLNYCDFEQSKRLILKNGSVVVSLLTMVKVLKYGF